MTSPPAPKGSKRQHVGKAVQRGYERFKQTVRPSSQLLSRNSASPAAPSTGKLREARRVVWSGLEKALRLLEQSSDAFPPLRSAVGALVECLDIVQAAATNDQDYEELTLELTTMASTLNRYMSELGSEDPSDSIARIALSIEAEVMHINKQQDRSKGRRMVESAQDGEDVIKRYRRIERLFRQLQGDIGLRTWSNTNAQHKQHVAALLRGMAPVDDARYNSGYSTTIKRRGCTAETREKVQADLQDWVRDPNAAKVYWMNGMAGTGKTTIAYSICEWLETSQRLGASFFCSRVSSSCRNVNSIIPTIAYQLARYSPAFQSALYKVLENDPDANRLNVVRQFEKLVKEPMLSSKDAMPEGVVVVIDALDECEDDYGVRLVLGTLLRLGTSLPLKFFVTSRPEPAIRDNMLSPDKYPPAILHLHDIEQSIVEEDIKKYLAEALSSMSPPPSDKHVEQLAKRAGKLFIYAATAVRFILPGKGPANSIARLSSMLGTDPSTNKEQSSKKYKMLDELYSTVLAAAFGEEGLEEEVEIMRLVLRTTVCAKEPMAALTMASLLDLTEEQVSSALQPLQSVLHVSEAGGLISTLHASFPDYLLDELRSGDFYCDRTQHNGLLAHRCFDAMKEQLQFNICCLESSFVFDKDVPELKHRIKSHITPTLFYACQYWGEHLQLAAGSDMLHSKLVDFLTRRLLFWMEVLNLRQCVVKGISILIQAEKWLAAVTLTSAKKQVNDARDFVTRFAAGACSLSTPHIYISALPLCARSSSVYTNYWGRTQGLINLTGTAISRRGNAAQATWMSDSSVRSVAFSPDGVRIASGSSDQTIRVWDARTGDVIAEPFQGHTGSVRSVAFSPDSTRIVSGSSDRTIRLWDVRTGNAITEPLEGHTASVKSVAYSPDGTCIVSGSSDRTIRMWDAYTGDTTTEPFKGHTGSVRSVAFSPDGMHIVSGSDDQTIRVWDVHTGNVIAEPFNGHAGLVRSVAFSPDGTRIASGSTDGTIRVWNAHTGDATTEPFKGHTDWIESVAFSPDGTRIVSGSFDQIIRVWDARTGDTIGEPFNGHTDSVRSVGFSPDGTRIVSGSSDRTIRVWDACTVGVIAKPFKGHTGWVESVVFSPDGTHIVSGSSDKTILVWDVCTGNAVTEPFKGHTGSVKSVAFSPDGTCIVSGSTDGTIRVWDTCTGNVITEPFNRHTSAIGSVAFSPDGSHIVSGSADGIIQVWDTYTGGTVTEPFKGHIGSVRSVAFSPDGTRIVSGSFDQTIRVWDSRTGTTIIEPFKGHTDSVKSVAYSPDGTRIASGSTDGTIRVWNAHTGDAITEPFKGHTDWIESVAFSPDGTRIVSGSTDATIRVWDAHTGNSVTRAFSGHINSVRSVAFSPDGTRIASGSSDQTIRVWDASTGNFIAEPFHRHTNSVKSTPFSTHDTYVLPSLGNNPAALLLDLPTTRNLNPIPKYYSPGAFMNVVDPKPRSDGWITANSIPLLWVSPDFFVHLPYPRNTLVIGPQGTAFLDYRDLLLGNRWSECYIS